VYNYVGAWYSTTAVLDQSQHPLYTWGGKGCGVTYSPLPAGCMFLCRWSGKKHSPWSVLGGGWCQTCHLPMQLQLCVCACVSGGSKMLNNHNTWKGGILPCAGQWHLFLMLSASSLRAQSGLNSFWSSAIVHEHISHWTEMHLPVDSQTVHYTHLRVWSWWTWFRIVVLHVLVQFVYTSHAPRPLCGQ